MIPARTEFRDPEGRLYCTAKTDIRQMMRGPLRDQFEWPGEPPKKRSPLPGWFRAQAVALLRQP